MAEFKFEPGEFINRLIEELTRLKEAEKLLSDVWMYVDPYSGKVGRFASEKDALPSELVDNLRRFFDFDDSE